MCENFKLFGALLEITSIFDFGDHNSSKENSNKVQSSQLPIFIGIILIYIYICDPFYY